MTNYRSLQLNEIDSLVKQRCSCDDWENIKVKEGFSTDFVQEVHFSGKITIGLFNKDFATASGLIKHSGLFKANIHNCELADNIYVAGINDQVSNYKIETGAFISNVTCITCNKLSSFGNGTKVSLLNEAGGREIQIFDKLSSQLAYMVALYRHETSFQSNIDTLIQDYTNSIRANYGTIGAHAKIVNCGTINEVNIGAFSSINGASLLDNGSINSNQEDPAIVGQQVIARNFIFSSGSKVTDAALVENSFIGQAAEISKQFSVYDSAFFCNSQGFHGEACSVFAGPYTASHHKASLLIAGMFSFMNTGSGSNQSNHMYKLGPVHQGILERGGKTASDSYILWPAKIGAFTMVMGRHYSHPDTSNFPFSYLIENKGDSYLVPGINITSIGTLRDIEKWPKRDLRKDPNTLDKINFNQLSPYTLNKVYKGKECLITLQDAAKETEIYHYQGVKIKKSALAHGIAYYQMIIDTFIGDKLLEQLQAIELSKLNEWQIAMQNKTKLGHGKWLDVSGMLCPAAAVTSLIDSIKNKDIKEIGELNANLLSLHAKYDEFEWRWVLDKIDITADTTKKDFKSVLLNLITKWKEQTIKLNELRMKDATKEYSSTFKCSFGEDQTTKEKELDFEQVRGKIENNPFIKELKLAYQTKIKTADLIIEQLKQLS